MNQKTTMRLPTMNSSNDFLTAIEIIKSQGKESNWSELMIAQQISAFAQDWQGRRESDLLRRHRNYE